MRSFLIIIAFFTCLVSYSQVVNNLIVFCNDGEPFTLIMNGERYNNDPQTKVRATGLTLKKYQVRIIFQNPKIKETKTTLTFFSTGRECEFALNRHGKKYKMDYFTEKAIEGFEQINSDGKGQSQSAPVKNEEASQITNVNSTAPAASPTVNSQPASPPEPITGTSPAPVKCNTPLNQAEFEKYKNDILKKATDAEKKAIANMLVDGNCLLTNQVKEILGLFASDVMKLEFAKKAYSNTKDFINYSNLTETFISAPVKEEFKKFLSNKK
jgi:hypothetical protein